MQNSYLQTKITNKIIILINILSLLPLLAYGVYKNIFVVYKRGLLDNHDLINNIGIILVTLTLPIIIDFIYSIILKKNIKEYVTNSYSLVYSLLYLLLMPPSFNILIYLLGLLLIQIASKINIPFRINLVALIKIAVIILMFKNYSYENIYESTKNIYYNLFDSFFGRTVGSYGTTCIFLVLLSYVFLSLSPHYKKEIPILSIATFTITGIIYYLITKSSGFNVVDDLINTNFMFCVVFISTISFYSPYTTEANIIYAILIGIISFIFIKHISFYEGTLIAIFILSIIINLLDKLILKIKR